MGNLLEGDFGLSMVYANRSVSSIISSGIKVSADLGIRALIIALTVGITLGIFQLHTISASLTI
jgi:oligopeptide transport system permease protein